MPDNVRTALAVLALIIAIGSAISGLLVRRALLELRATRSLTPSIPPWTERDRPIASFTAPILCNATSMESGIPTRCVLLTDARGTHTGGHIFGVDRRDIPLELASRCQTVVDSHRCILRDAAPPNVLHMGDHVLGQMRQEWPSE